MSIRDLSTAVALLGTLITPAYAKWAMLSFGSGPTVPYVDHSEGRHVKCLKPAKELNGLCRQYEIK
jgi:hypothetical protein